VSPISVLDLRDTHEIGGPGKTILETYRAVDASRFRLHLGVFVTRHESGESPFVAEARALGMPVHFIRGYNQYDPRLISRLAKLVDALGIDIVHAHEAKSDVLTYLASKLTRFATVTTLHGWIGNGLKQRAFNALDKRVARKFDRVIAVSAPIREQLAASGVPEKNLRLVHNAIVIERYKRTGNRGFLAELVGRPVAGPVLASIGRMSPEKGHADFVEALGIVARRGHKVSAVIAGEGPERARLQQQVRDMGLADSIHMPGYVSQPERVLEETDLAVLPSHTEGLPNAALEALVMGVPVLATRVGGTPEVVTDGETGRLVPAGAPEALADAIADFATDAEPWRRMALRGREVVERQFNFAGRARKMEAIYEELVG
jgi:glycosyltransferase involved in cell wall biosynthesis